jgi:rhamnosyltransferase
MDASSICILMATYNGARYVQEQILSIQQQTIRGWILLIRDDGSTDDTLPLVDKLAEKDDRIIVLRDSEGPSLGAAQNFGRLIQAGLETSSDIFFLCDQDDMWEPNKLRRQSQYFPDRGREPASLLVHSDLSVVDERLLPVHPSMIAHMALDIHPSHPFTYLLSRNFVTGCATAGNRHLLEDALPIPANAIMHDWWLALVAAMNGVIEFVDEPLIKYRQHSSNTIGAKGFWQGLIPTRNWVDAWRIGNQNFLETFDQAQALLDVSRGHQDWPSERIVFLRAYTQLLALPLYRRFKEARRMGLRQGKVLLQALFYLRLLTLRKPRQPP